MNNICTIQHFIKRSCGFGDIDMIAKLQKDIYFQQHINTLSKYYKSMLHTVELFRQKMFIAYKHCLYIL